ncbi:hypothetical protein Belba_2605 [Belliella baltica DSM 15883]|uniref:DUF4249 domain-containing protein n=1 Tax=Belliella baltica (strain DSM 15883 / CIP 108006 / LMG 21964 / BA134) TaxID=866536 RepID=I3Z7D2_BELBD|nr:DUF4249 family protein [Belliella baltica]AFL85150.1 hypothetical protein Belba_2605 [Belliella baltica DSM 15883]
MRNSILLILLAILNFSCQEEVFLDLQKSERTPVIEAVWTNTVGLNQVQVSFSRDYYSEDPNEIVTDADVFILNLEDNQRIRFRFNEQFQSYLPVNNVTGKLGAIYELHVIIEGKEYISQGKMLEPPVLDSLTFAYQEERVFREEGYYLTLYGKIPFVDDNNYRIRIIRNDTLLNRRSDYLLFDDSFGTSILDRGFELSGFAFNEGDRVRLELFRLNLDVYDYLSQLVNLLFNDGGLFSPPPQNPVSNIRPLDGEGDVLGYFMVSPYLGAVVNIVEDKSD